MSANAEDPRLLSVAGAVADGTAIDWQQVQAEDPEERVILEELRTLERFTGINAETPVEWGPFLIVGELGRGVFGRVYRAVDQTLHRDVALKVIRLGAGADAVDLERALNEGRLLARIKHSNVVHVDRAERIGDEVGIAMELVRGHTLDELVRSRGPYSAEEATVIGLDLCRALAAVHAAGALHGDVKAHNVMREAGGRTVLMDFGVARDVTHAPVGQDFAGTPVYLAPEVFAGSPRSAASDIYSLGVLLYFLVSASYPVEGDTRSEIGRRHHASGAKKPLRDVRPDLPAAFVQVVEQALAEKPEDRYRSAGALETALVGTRTDTQRRTWVGRSGIMVLSATALVVVVLAALSWWSNDRGTIASVNPPAPVINVSGDAPAVANAAAASMYQIEAALYSEHGGTDVRLRHGMRVSPGDKLSLKVASSAPAYVYVVNEDEQGQAYLLFPLPGQSVTNPLSGGGQYRLPGVQNGQQLSWQVTSAGGREHFLLFASPERLPAFEQMFASLPIPTLERPVEAVRLSREAVGMLRGVGGLAPAPTQVDQQLRLARDFATPLTDGQETVRGVWIRQITLENPLP